MRQLLLVRHGETNQNAEGILQGQGRGDLSAQGKKQMQALAERLKAKSITKILSSDLERARLTTAAITQYHSSPVEHLPVLRERTFGVHEGKTLAEYHEVASAHQGDPFQFRPEGGESVEDFFQRCQAIWNLVDSQEEETLLISTHGGVIRGLVCLYENRKEDFYKVKVENTSLTLFQRAPEKPWVLQFLNCTEHLSTI